MPDPTALIPARLADAYAAARDICRHHAHSFFFASRFLPAPKRDHAYAVYAFCRLLDDAADESPSPGSVDRFAALLDAIYAGAPIDPADLSRRDALALRAFAHTVRACGIDKQHFVDLAEGCRMDFTVHRYATWPALERYCYRVAGVVGLVMCDVLGLRHAAARAQAVAMGNAMQLTNILRDVREDAARGRIYLPRADLDRFGVSEADLVAGDLTQPIVALLRFEIDRARALYADGERGLAYLPADGARFTACVMRVVYAGILDAIEDLGYDVFHARARLTTWQKLTRVPAALRLNRREVGDEGVVRSDE